MFEKYNSRIRYNTYNIDESDQIKIKENLTNDYGINLGKFKKNYSNEFEIKNCKNNNYKKY